MGATGCLQLSVKISVESHFFSSMIPSHGPPNLRGKLPAPLLSSPVSGLSRTLDESGPSPVPIDRESPGKRGPQCPLVALDHRECGRTGIWHLSFDGNW